jgi:prepilin peptidase CpaA
MSGVLSTAAFLQPTIVALAAIALGFASLHDIATRTIPDVASAGLLVLGIAARLADHAAIAALVTSIAVLVLGAVCWRFGWVGGGDVKLLTAAAWLVPPLLVPQLLLLTALAGGGLACLYLCLGGLAKKSRAPVCAGCSRSLTRRVLHVEWWRIKRRASLPYGCAISIATLIVLYSR